jgi:spore coat polysaccharide biosynthesis protein SpsF (cytidylyltransferase family)
LDRGVLDSDFVPELVHPVHGRDEKVAMQKPIIVICTRPDSKRVPNKALIPVAGRRAIRHILERVKNTFPVILAVPNGCDAYDSAAAEYGAEVFKGQSQDPLRRMEEAVRCSKYIQNGDLPEYVIRITHDDLLIDRREMMEMVADTVLRGAGYGYSPGVLDGCGTEAIAWVNLVAAGVRHKGPVEHISYFVRGMPPNPVIVAHPPRPEICRSYRMTLDYPEDLTALELVLRKLGPDATNEQICEFLDLHPQIMQINARPTLTVYTCAKDAEAFVTEAIESVLFNSFPDMEYVFIDDGSIDDTPLIAAKYVSGRGTPFRLFLNDYNKGLSSSSNHAVAQARGRYVLRLDADDMLLPTAIPLLVKEIENTGADIVYPDYRVIGESVKGGLDIGSCVKGSVHHHAGGAIMRRQFINALWFKEGLKWWDSLELYKRAKEVGKIAYLDQPAFYYRQHNGNLTKQDPAGRKAAAIELGLV